MKKKLNCVMLIDDDEANNFLNKRIIDKMDFTEHIEVANNGLQAMELLNKGIKMELCLPRLIFLDLNMPIMDGWEFLEEFHKLSYSLRKMIKVIVLTTSLNPDDRSKAESLTEIIGYLNKPLRGIFIEPLLKEHFNMF